MKRNKTAEPNISAYRKLRADLLKRLKCSPQAVSQRVSRIRKELGPLSSKEGVFVIAHEQGIDLSKYLDNEAVSRVREIIGRRAEKVSPFPRRDKQVAKVNRVNLLNISGELPRVDALLSTSLAVDAGKMAKIYPMYYVLENSLRVVIMRVLGKKYGSNWWQAKVPREPQNNVDRRKNEEYKKPYHGKRGQHEIFYSDFKDLKSIIKANWTDFEPIFSDLEWISQKLSELETPRNIVAHHNPLDENDILRIKVFFTDWTKLLSEKKHLI